jgi:outer membrane protein assembly factor BamB
VVGARKVYLLDRLTGEELATFSLRFAYGTPAVGDLEMLYLGSADGRMYGVRWDTARAGAGGVRVWQVLTDGAIRSRPAFDGTNLWFASSGGGIYSCEAYDRLGRWIAQTDGGVVANLVYHESGIYAATTGRSIYQIDPDTGRVGWQARVPTPLEKNPIIAGRTLYQECGDAGLYAIDIDSGSVAWFRPDVRSFVARKADKVTVLAANGERLWVLDNNTGKQVRSLEIHDADLVVPNPNDDAIYLVSRTNQVVCLRTADVPYLTLEAIAEARARLFGHADQGQGATPPAAPPPPSRSPGDVLRSEHDITPLAGD